MAAATKPAPRARPRPRLAPRRLAPETYARLAAIYPDARCELDHRTAFELLVATVLSAQTTDRAVNQATPELFARYPSPRALADAELAELERLVGRLGFFHQKAKNIKALARALCERHGGEVPASMNELTALAGVGRKTANVVLGNAFHAPEGVVVDTHVQRLAQRLGWSRSTTPEAIERDLNGLFPRGDWAQVPHVLIFHGRRACFAHKPACASCGVRDACPSAGRAERVGRKPTRARRGAGERG